MVVLTTGGDELSHDGTFSMWPVYAPLLLPKVQYLIKGIMGFLNGLYAKFISMA